MNAPKTVKVPCSGCGGGYKNHVVHFTMERPWDDEEMGAGGADTYEIVECEGCDTLRFRHLSWNSSGPFDEDMDAPLTQVTIYPTQEGPSSSYGDVPQGPRFTPLDPIPKKVLAIYMETIQARDAGASILAGAGLRAIVEALCLSQGLNNGSLQAKIDGLVAKGLLAKPQADALHEQRSLGNSVLHEIEAPSKSEIADGLAIVETLLHTIFVLPEHVDRMRKTREARENKKAEKGKTANSDTESV